MNYEVIADRDNGDDPRQSDIEETDRVTYGFIGRGFEHGIVHIERPVPADEPQKPELVTLHLYRDTCVGGLFLSERELDRTLHEHVEALTIRRDRLPSPHPPTREQIVKAILPVMANDWDRTLAPSPTRIANAVLTLIQNGADRG